MCMRLVNEENGTQDDKRFIKGILTFHQHFPCGKTTIETALKVCITLTLFIIWISSSISTFVNIEIKGKVSHFKHYKYKWNF